MGYYTGNGVIVSGSKAITQQDTVIAGGTLVRERLSQSETLVKNGVSLATAQGATPTCSSKCGDLTCGSYIWATPNASGIIENYHYAQINGSNRYQLVKETLKYQMRLSAHNGAGSLDHGGWMALP